MTYALLHFAALLIPGWLLTQGRLLGAERFLLVVALSYAYYTLIAAAVMAAGWDISTLYLVYAIGLLVLAINAVFPRPTIDSSQNIPPFVFYVGALVVAGLYLAYRLIVGAYTELPADVFNHLGYVQQHVDNLAAGHLNRELSITQLLHQAGGIWYGLFAILSALAGSQIADTYTLAMAINASLFLVAVYVFAWFLFGGFELGDNQRAVAAVLAAGFTFAHMGINLFAFIRYYTFAPATLNFILYFAAIVCVMQMLDRRRFDVSKTIWVMLITVSAAMIHNQEALFILVMGGLLLIIATAKRFVQQRAGYGTRQAVLQSRQEPLVWLLVLGMIATVAVLLTVYLSQDRPTDLFNKVLQASQQGPVFNRILFLNPEYQFIRVLTIWGVLVYGLFIWHWRWLCRSPYLLAGMLVPLVTVFNPVFVDFFLRLDGPHTLWRLLYLLPIHFIGALLLVRYGALIFSAATPVWHRTIAVVMAFLLIALLFPIQIGGFGNSYSRLTLAPVKPQNDVSQWQDLLDFLNTQSPERQILTDPVTGYAVAGLTTHNTYRYKFLRMGSYLTHPFSFESYTDKPLAKYRGWWLIINDRAGGHSEVGARARHWPADVLDTTRFYTNALREHLASNPDRFQRLWQQNQISVYAIID